MKPSFKNIDLFKRLPKDLTEGSYFGAIISIGCIMTIVSLCMFEFSSFFNDKVSSVMKIEQIDPHQQMQVNIEIDFPSCPCDVISLDIIDEMGTHIEDSTETLQKIRRNTKVGATDIRMNAVGQANVQNSVERARQAFNDGEGCTLQGFIMINRVASNFHIGAHSYGQILNMVGKNLNLTHQIKHISFGRKYHIESIQNKFKGRYGELTPLNGHYETSERFGKTTNYNLDIVPTTYHDRLGFRYPVFQFAYGIGGEYTGNEIIFFNLSIKGVTVNYFQTSESLLQF